MNNVTYRFNLMIFGLNLLISDLIEKWCRENGFEPINKSLEVHTLNGFRSIEILGEIYISALQKVNYI